MAYDYVDDHRLLRIRDGQTRDITAFAGDMQAVDELGALSVDLSFTVLTAPWDKYVERRIVQPGDRLRLVNHGATVFAGQVERVGLDGGVTAYDYGWYLNKSQLVLQITGMAADAAIRQVCGKAGVAVSALCPLPAKLTQLWTGDTPADILSDILEACAAETGKTYQYYVREDGLVVHPLPETAIRAWHKPAANLAAFDITWALGKVTGEDSIADLRNAVVIAAEADERAYTGAQASNAASIGRYGLLQHVEVVQSNPGTRGLEQLARRLLAQLDRVGHTRTVEELWGCDEVRSGVVLDFNSPAFGLVGRHRVQSVTHHYGGAGHTMALELTALDEPRAADEADTVHVPGLPASIPAGDGVTTGGTGGAAAFVSTAAGEVGYREGAGNQTKYGAWAGNNGAAWCVYFIGWCAAQAGAPIPTGYGYVGDMAAYFQRRGQYHTVASGYIPKAGDLMIQGTRHIGIVRSATRASVQTIEGNYADSVAAVTRYYSEITGFCTPWG